MTLLAPIVLAIYLPWDFGVDWVEGPPSILIAAVIPLMLVGMMIPDSFAGERERNTLTTLLASRLSDRAILFGKIAVAVGLAWGVTLIVLLLSMLTVNITHWEGTLLVYEPEIALADLTLSFLMATLVASAGVLISLRSATVQEAQQFLMMVFLVPSMPLSMIFILLRDKIPDAFRALDSTQIVLIIAAVMAVASLGLLRAAMTRFRRARLILS
jgi:ABC-2 type transport system permease protein